MTTGSGTIMGALLCASLLAITALVSPAALAAGDSAAHRDRVISHWTAERRAAAIPRDFVIDARGLGYIRRADGTLVPHGHQISAAPQSAPQVRARPDGPGGGGNDTEAPQISNMDPSGGTIGASHVFSATVTDNVGVRSVTFVVTYPDGSTTQSFSASNSGGDTWSTTLSGFTDGNWSWQVIAKDTARRGGNTATSPPVAFTVSTGGGTGNGDTITSARWTGGGDIQLAAGRLFYEMPSNPRRKRWVGYVCSGTVVSDGATGRSVILTAAHCVYDDANGAFARNVLFIPDQDGTSGRGTDSNCSNDPIGCWVASFGVVDRNWTQAVFPDNIPWDYAFYVVDDTGAHQQGQATTGDSLDGAVNELSLDFTAPAFNDGTAGAGTPDFTHALGYSYSDDPNFMYCAEDMTTEGTDNWWLPSCGLSGGSSGGPWVQPLSNGKGPVISVNSWGYNGSPGMAGPKLNDGSSTARCVLDAAVGNAFPANVADGDAGYAASCN